MLRARDGSWAAKRLSASFGLASSPNTTARSGPLRKAQSRDPPRRAHVPLSKRTSRAHRGRLETGRVRTSDADPLPLICEDNLCEEHRRPRLHRLHRSPPRYRSASPSLTAFVRLPSSPAHNLEDGPGPVPALASGRLFLWRPSHSPRSSGARLVDGRRAHRHGGRATVRPAPFVAQRWPRLISSSRPLLVVAGLEATYAAVLRGQDHRPRQQRVPRRRGRADSGRRPREQNVNLAAHRL